MTADPVSPQTPEPRDLRIALERVYDEVYDAMVTYGVDEDKIRLKVEHAIEDAYEEMRPHDR